ncbi:MAG: hypothetical protein Q6366_010530 [Candidatus Freyarchaeota archaeon]
MYEKIYSVWEKEQKEESLQKLQANFYIEAKKFLEEIKLEKNESDPLASKLVKKEYDILYLILNDLINIRLEKILRNIHAKKELNTEKLTQEEKVIYEHLKNAFSQLFNGKSLSPEIRVIEEKDETFIPIRFLKQIPAIVGSDMKIYGPFQVEDIATLPRENAKALILKNAAKLLFFQQI